MAGTTNSGFGASAWRGIRPHALSAVIDSGVTLTIWGMVLVAHIARKLMGVAGIDPEFVGYVGFCEKYVFLASFGELFYRILMRSISRIRKQEL
jgi:hypothetical protein